MERIDIYDVDRIRTGKILNRGEKLKEGEYRLVVHCYIFNSKGELLIQKRTPNKAAFPNNWDVTAGGSAIAGENSRQAMHRELFEELGLDVDFSKSHPKMTANFSEGFDDIYILNMDVDINKLKFQPEEVEDAKWATMEETFKMIDDGSFIPYKKDYIRYCFELKNLGVTINDNDEEV